jgi:hypothetical protein
MIKKLSLGLVILCSVMSFGQNKFNRLSIETGYGYVSPSKLYGADFSKSDFSGFNHFDIGMRYMIKSNFGVKLNYASDIFSKGDAGVSYNTINASAVYNLGSLFDLNYMTYEKIGLLGRVGLGVTFANLESVSYYERIGSATIGLTPQVKLNQRISIYGDVAYTLNFKQHYGFDGILLDKDYKSEVGKTTVLSIGLIFYVGENSTHADWY